jgi:hypothetical protein
LVSTNRFKSANICRKYIYAKPEDFKSKHIEFTMIQSQFTVLKLNLKKVNNKKDSDFNFRILFCAFRLQIFAVLRYVEP